MTRQRRPDIIDGLDFTLQDLDDLLERLESAVEPFADGLGGKFEPYNPARVEAYRTALATAKMHLHHLFNEVPHIPKSGRAPEPVISDEE